MNNYAVIHVSKGKGNSSGLSKHIERETTPENANPEHAHLNVKEDYSHLGKTLGERADTVIKRSGIKRKVQADAVKYCPIILSGSHERMKEIEGFDCIDEWYKENKKFIEAKYGKENVISFAMHRDEKTPHIHAVVVPIVQDKDSKGNDRTRLSARDKFNPEALKQLQTDYADYIKDYGLVRGREGSKAKHTTVEQFYKDARDKENLIAEVEKYRSMTSLEAQTKKVISAVNNILQKEEINIRIGLNDRNLICEKVNIKKKDNELEL